MSVLIPVPCGELIDKITILEIKSERLESSAALGHVRHELQLLSQIADGIEDQTGKLAVLKASLKNINEQLWDIEDKIRQKEAQKRFDHDFIQLARSVYRINDQRGLLKREIDLLLKSDLIEEK